MLFAKFDEVLSSKKTHGKNTEKMGKDTGKVMGKSGKRVVIDFCDSFTSFKS